MDEVGQCDAAMKEPGPEEVMSTVEKEDVRVDNNVPVSLYRIDVQSFSVSGRVSVVCG